MMKSKFEFIVLVGSFLILAWPFVAGAQDRNDFIILKLGTYTPSGDLDDAEFDSGFSGEAAWGHYYSDYVSAEGGVGFATADFSASATIAGIGTVSTEQDIVFSSIFARLKGHYPLRFGELYGGAGLDILFADLDADFDTPLADLSFSDTDHFVFGGHLVAGVLFHVTDRWFVGLEGNYLITTDAEFSGSDQGFLFEAEADLNGYRLFGQIGYRF